MKHRIASPRLPRLRKSFGLCGSHATKTLSQRDVLLWKRIGPPQCTHRDKWAVHAPIPGRATSCAIVLSGSSTASSLKRSETTSARERPPFLRARDGILRWTLSSSTGVAAMRSAVGGAGDPARHGACGSDRRTWSTNRPAIVVAALTLTCCPRMARTASSNPSKAPGSGMPGL